ncbi:MAG: glycosyltransferase, partial [Chitinophagaceae bacterium]
LDQSERIVLFFGFIREYKGLDLLLEAMAMLKDRLPKENMKMPKLLIAGEFYDNRKKYDAIVENLRLRDTVILHTDFIPDSQVRNYFCAADVVVQPYRNATQSGVTPLAYHFEVPMIVTNVGGLAALVPHERVGLVCEPTAASIADTLHRYFIMGREQFLPGLVEEKGKYSWGKLTEAILSF